MKRRFARLLLAVLTALALSAPAASAPPVIQPPPPILGVLDDVPGLTFVIPQALTPAQSEIAIHARVMPPGLVTRRPDPGTGGGGGSKAAPIAVAPPSIAELARALHNNPDLIYEYVRNNIEYYPEWGVQKGSLGALIDGRGTAFDQAALMGDLLAQSGIPATYVLGQIRLTGSQIGTWLGVSTANACAVRNLLAAAYIPVAAMTPSGLSGSCGALTSATISHIWVKATIGGVQYVFDPSYKPHTSVTGIDLVAATGYNAAGHMATARSGATVTADYVQNINRSGIQADLSTYATNLANYVRSNLPAGQLADLVGGNAIDPYIGPPLRQASLPYEISRSNEWTAIPDNYKPYVQIQYAGITKSFTSDALSGARLTIKYDTLHYAQLTYEGTVVATSPAPVSFDAQGAVTFSIHHINSALDQLNKNQYIVPKSSASNIFLVSNSWGPSGRGLIEFHRARLDAAKAAGMADTSEVVLGSTMAIVSATWITQTDRAAYIIDRLANTSTVLHHRVGIAGYNGGSYVDLPFNLVSRPVSQTGNAAIELTAFNSSGMHASIFESTAVQQVTTISAVSTVKLIDLAVNNYGLRIYDANASNYATNVKPNLTGCSSYLTDFGNRISGGSRLILPGSCTLNEARWTGVGFFDLKPNGVGAIISGNLAGGFASNPQTSSNLTNNSLSTSISPYESVVATGPSFGDPVDMSKGHYTYQHTDISVGVGAYPYALPFTRFYSSALRTQDGTLGCGWTHNYAWTVTEGSDGLQGLGEDSALDAAAAVTELMVAHDLLSDPAQPLDKVVSAILGQRWFGDQLVDNSVMVRTGLNGEVFIKLPDASYNPPPGNSVKLTKNADGTYSYEALHKARVDFNSSRQIAKYSLPNGLQVKFTYAGGNLSTVANSLGRQLTLTTTSGRLTSVGDGTRSAGYQVDASGNLATFTDTLSKSTSYTYDLPGRLASIFYPSFPSVAAMTNTYDSLGRVKTQANAFGKMYSYYFAGSRSEEVAPDGSSSVSYVDGLGNVLETINPVGQVTLNTYDGQSRLVRRVLPELNRIEYDYDDAPCAAQARCTHNVKSVRNVPKPSSTDPTVTMTATYESAFNYVNHATDPLGNVTDYTYTAQGDPDTATRPADSTGQRPTTSYAYTGFTPSGYPTFYLPTGVTRKIDAGHSTTTTTAYLTTNRYVPQTIIVDQGSGALNLVTTLTYDGTGNLTSVDGPRSDVADTTGYTYDKERRVVQITDANGKQTKLGYDPDGRQIRRASQIGAQWLVACRSYTQSGHLLKTWGPGLTSTDTTCPSAAAPVSVTDYGYDDLDRLQQVTVNLLPQEGGNRVSQTDYWPDSTVRAMRRAVGTSLAQSEVAYTYTANGNVATITDANSNITTYEYDGLDRRSKTRYPNPTTGASSSTDFEQYSYDANSNLTSLRTRAAQTINLGYDHLNRLLTRSYPAAPADNVRFDFDLLDRRTSANLSDGSYPINYVWDNAGRLGSTTAGGKTLSYQYDAAGNRTRITWPETTPFYVTTAYDALNRPTDIKELGSVLLAHYNYDDLSRRTTVTLGNSTTTSYSYDAQGMLQSLANDLSGTAQDITFTYARNQVQDLKNVVLSNDLYGWQTIQGTTTFTVDRQNRYTSVNGTAVSYDGNGNLANDGIWAYTFDAERRLRVASGNSISASLAWDAAGRMRQTAIGAATTNFLYDDTRLLADYDASGSLQRRYVHGPGVDEPIVKYEGAGTTNKSWYYKDHLGSILANADASGVPSECLAYGPFGEASGTPVRFGFTGQQYIAQLGLYYYKARVYSPALGRFLQPDPLGLHADMNVYGYARANPANSSDPSGLVNWRGVGSSALDIANNVAGIITGTVLTVTGVALIAAPEPTLISKPAGVVTTALGVANLANSGSGLVTSGVNLYDAIRDRSPTLPGSGLGIVASALYPGNQTAQQVAAIGDLSLALASGRVPVGTATINTYSALEQNVAVGINGLLDARAVAVPRGMEGILLPAGDPTRSFASTVLDALQVSQVGGAVVDTGRSLGTPQGPGKP